MCEPWQQSCLRLAGSLDVAEPGSVHRRTLPCCCLRLSPTICTRLKECGSLSAPYAFSLPAVVVTLGRTGCLLIHQAVTNVPPPPTLGGNSWSMETLTGLEQEPAAQANGPGVIGHPYHHPSEMPTPSCASITTSSNILPSNYHSEIILFICLPPTGESAPECQVWPVSMMALGSASG